MKHSGFILFLSIALILYTWMNWYLIRRGLQALPGPSGLRSAFTILIILLAAAYPLGRLCERSLNTGLGAFLVHIGAYYTAVLIFALLALIIIDLVRLADHFFPFLPAAWHEARSSARTLLLAGVAALTLILTLAGAINARHPRVRHLDIAIDKQAPFRHTRLLLATDIHLGTLVHNSRMQELVSLMQAQNPDLILFGGDLFDEDILSLSRQNMAEVLRQLQPPHGVYAIMGNHEHISGSKEAVRYMEESGITVLRDRAVRVAEAFWLIGREDRQAVFMGSGRQPLAELMAGIDRREPLILLDHQPFHLEEAVKEGIDLQLSGHTHHGQFFPFNLITGAMYEMSWGYLRKGSSHFYVSCGAGTWGPPVRLGSRPEIVVIDLTFNKK